jgi:hypothetical protein
LTRLSLTRSQVRIAAFGALRSQPPTPTIRESEMTQDAERLTGLGTHVEIDDDDGMKTLTWERKNDTIAVTISKAGNIHIVCTDFSGDRPVVSSRAFPSAILPYGLTAHDRP